MRALQDGEPMRNPTAAMIVIGDEILSGRTRDINAHVLAGALTELGIDLIEVRFVPDARDRIIDAVNALRTDVTYVFTSGGIGPTHDDITADCIAAAFDVSIDVRNDARAILEAHYRERGDTLNEARLRMARIPEGATLIDNPVSRAPGFSIGNVHVMAGVPKIFGAMLDGLLPTLTSGVPIQARTLRVEKPEGEVAATLARFSDANDDLSVGCYPFNESGLIGCNVVIRHADGARLDAAEAALAGELAA